MREKLIFKVLKEIENTKAVNTLFALSFPGKNGLQESQAPGTIIKSGARKLTFSGEGLC